MRLLIELGNKLGFFSYIFFIFPLTELVPRSPFPDPRPPFPTPHSSFSFLIPLLVTRSTLPVPRSPFPTNIIFCMYMGNIKKGNSKKEVPLHMLNLSPSPTNQNNQKMGKQRSRITVFNHFPAYITSTHFIVKVLS